jgi:hypothetical protein
MSTKSDENTDSAVEQCSTKRALKRIINRAHGNSLHLHVNLHVNLHTNVVDNLSNNLINTNHTNDYSNVNNDSLYLSNLSNIINVSRISDVLSSSAAKDVSTSSINKMYINSCMGCSMNGCYCEKCVRSNQNVYDIYTILTEKSKQKWKEKMYQLKTLTSLFFKEVVFSQVLIIWAMWYLLTR